MTEKATLDRIDFGILAALQKDARRSNKALAAEVGLAPSSCLERVRRLRAAGILGEAHAEVDPGALGIGLEALIAVRIKRHSRAMIEAFERDVLLPEEVISVYHVAGANDFLVHVVVRDAGHLRAFALDALTTRPEVEHVETSLVFGHHHKHVLPIYAAEAAGD